MASVIAKSNIVTPKGLCIARKGDVGVAVKEATPYDPSHVGKVLVRFNKRSRAYWCDLGVVKFPTGTDIELYKGKLEKFDPFAQSVPLPNLSTKDSYHFGKNLRLCRQARRMTQSELGHGMKRFGLKAAQATICYRESRPYSPNGKFIDAAARVLQVPAWIFFIDISNCSVFSKARRFLLQLSSSVCEVKHGDAG